MSTKPILLAYVSLPFDVGPYVKKNGLVALSLATGPHRPNRPVVISLSWACIDLFLLVFAA